MVHPAESWAGSRRLAVSAASLATRTFSMAPKAASRPSAIRRERRLRARATLKELHTRPSLGDISALERIAIRGTSETLYRRMISAFLEFVGPRRLDWSSFESLDRTLVQYFNDQYEDGMGASHGDQTIAALVHVMPELTKVWKARLPRAARCLTGWRRRTPGSTRMPMPLTVAAALAAYMAHRGHRRMAVCVMLSHVCYLRPAEAMRLTGRSLVPPTRDAGDIYQSWGLLLHISNLALLPGNTGNWDESILVDREGGMLAPILEVMKASTPPDTSLWPFEMDEYRALFSEAGRALQLHSLAPHPYQLRHGGASDDLLSGRRTAADVMRRGRWVTESSLRRYGKETELLEAIGKIPSDILLFGQAVISQFANVIAHGVTDCPGLLVPLRTLRLLDASAAAPRRRRK